MTKDEIIAKLALVPAFLAGRPGGLSDLTDEYNRLNNTPYNTCGGDCRSCFYGSDKLGNVFLTNCDGCSECARCLNCSDCKHCCACNGSSNLLYCSNCTDCSYCFLCADLTSKKYMVLNVDIGKEAWEAWQRWSSAVRKANELANK